MRDLDVIGKSTGRSVRELLGGYRDTNPIISIGGYYMEGKMLADIGREIEQYRDAGMAGAKSSGGRGVAAGGCPARRGGT